MSMLYDDPAAIDENVVYTGVSSKVINEPIVGGLVYFSTVYGNLMPAVPPAELLLEFYSLPGVTLPSLAWNPPPPIEF